MPASDLVSLDCLLPEGKNGFWVQFTWCILMSGVGCAVTRKGSFLSPDCKGECYNSYGGIYNERKWIPSKVSPHALALLLTNPFLLSLGSLQRLVSAKPREVVLPTDFSTAGNTTEIMPLKLMFQDTLMFKDLQVIFLLCEEKGYQEEKRLKSCPHIPQPSESIPQGVSYYKPEAKCANCIPACALSAKSPKGLGDLKWDFRAWTQKGSPQNSHSAVTKAQQHLRVFSERLYRRAC